MPVVTADLVYLHGQSALVLPDLPGARDNTSIQWRLGWHGLTNAQGSSQVLTSFGDGDTSGAVVVDTTLSALRGLTFVAGAVDRLVVDSLGSQVRIAFPRSWRLPAASLLPLVRGLYRRSQDLWGDPGPSRVLVAVLPTEDPPGNIGGEGRTASISVFASRELATWNPAAHTLAHELVHLWNPQRFGRGWDERLYWFIEGITDYATQAILFREGLTSPRDLVNAYNSTRRSYHTSSALGLGVDSMLVARRNSEAARRLPYQQGHLLAAHWSGLIHSRSAGTATLDDALRSLLKRVRGGAAFQVSTVASEIARWARVPQDQILREINGVIVRGDMTVPVDSTLFGPCVTVRDSLVAVLHVGFDLDALRTERRVRRVEEGSAAHRAGLRDGQRWVGGGLAADPEQLADLVVEDSSGRKTVKFYPAASERARIPVMHLRASTASCFAAFSGSGRRAPRRPHGSSP